MGAIAAAKLIGWDARVLYLGPAFGLTPHRNATAVLAVGLDDQLEVADDPADRAFRQEVREWVAANCPTKLCNRSTRIDPPELKPWHRQLYERGWIAPH